MKGSCNRKYSFGKTIQIWNGKILKIRILPPIKLGDTDKIITEEEIHSNFRKSLPKNKRYKQKI